jgi:hypothetical protein
MNLSDTFKPGFTFPHDTPRARQVALAKKLLAIDACTNCLQNIELILDNNRAEIVAPIIISMGRPGRNVCPRRIVLTWRDSAARLRDSLLRCEFIESSDEKILPVDSETREPLKNNEMISAAGLPVIAMLAGENQHINLLSRHAGFVPEARYTRPRDEERAAQMMCVRMRYAINSGKAYELLRSLNNLPQPLMWNPY